MVMGWTRLGTFVFLPTASTGWKLGLFTENWSPTSKLEMTRSTVIETCMPPMPEWHL